MTQKSICKIDTDGRKFWYKNGKLHREDGPAIKYADGRKFWYKNGKLHREDGPAIKYANGRKCWYINGQRHRDDGPAVVNHNSHIAWYLNDRIYSFKDYVKVANWSDEQIVMYKLEHG